MNPAQYYQQQLEANLIEADPAQAAVIAELQALHDRLTEALEWRQTLGVFSRFLRKGVRGQETIRGLYIWGGVGRGKTWLADIFYNQLPIDNKMRLHFHQFMQNTHHELSQLRSQNDPLKRVAEKLARKTCILFLDEFIVTDIGDAMILGQLLKALFDYGVTLVTTSNTPPGELYRDGIQRASFLPAIDLLKRHTKVLNLDGNLDYRQRFLEQSTIYHTPLNETVPAAMAAEFEQLAPEKGQIGGKIHIFGRDIPVVRVADDVVWFDFMALCGPPRSQADYLELACRFHSVLLSDIPVLNPALDDVARRFIYLIDEFYDRGVKLIISAATPPGSLYQGERLAFDFRRVTSRLREMQSVEYMGKAHRP